MGWGAAIDMAMASHRRRMLRSTGAIRNQALAQTLFEYEITMVARDVCYIIIHIFASACGACTDLEGSRASCRTAPIQFGIENYSTYNCKSSDKSAEQFCVCLCLCCASLALFTLHTFSHAFESPTQFWCIGWMVAFVLHTQCEPAKWTDIVVRDIVEME